MATTPGLPADSELSRLHREHYRSLVRLASLLVDDVGTCEELVQDAFAAVLARGRRLPDGPAAAAYLRSAVLNAARTHLRRRTVRQRPRPLQVVRTEGSAEAGALVEEEHRTVLAALRALPARQREVLALRYYLELTEAEIAETLHIAAGTVKVHAHRGLATLHRALEDRR